MKDRWIAMIGMVFAGPVLAQAPPGSDLYLLPMGSQGPDVAAVKNITARAGYDNQPAFSGDGERIFYTRIANEQADIWYYDLKSGQRGAVAETPLSEYSPTPIPGRDALSVVRVEDDQRQRLWSLSLSGDGEQLLLPDLEPVGYHAWLEDQRLVLFILGEPHTLQTVTLTDQTPRVVAENIGRGMQPLPGGQSAAFIQIRDEESWEIAVYDARDDKTHTLIATRPGSQDFAIDGKGRLWMGEDSRLYTTPSSGPAEWTLVADLAAAGISNISRLAIHPRSEYLVVVADEPASAEQ